MFRAVCSKEEMERIAQVINLGRMGEPEDIAGVVAFFAGPEGTWINGQQIIVNGVVEYKIGQQNYPTHQARHICKAHKADTQKPTLQESLSCSYASGTHPATLDKVFSLTQQDEGRTYNL